MKMQRIGVLGASFNPPTVGHKDVIEQSLPHFDLILLVPSVAHAFGKVLAPLADRLAMLKLFVTTWQQNLNHKVEICLIEESVQQEKGDGPVYTYDVLEALTQHYQCLQHPVQIQFIVGPDIHSPAVWQKFYRYQDIEQRWPLFIVKENIAIHSTLVREICTQHAHNNITRLRELEKLVGVDIAQYIEQHQLYTNKDSTYG